MLLSIWYEDVSPQGVCPPVCHRTRQTQQHQGGHWLLCSFRCRFPHLTYVLKVLLPSVQEKGGLLVPTCCKRFSELQQAEF